ncbi:MAG: DUF3995 domain-containing protein [Acidobacteria bacterium]|nr:DUF3995 domain-containing protein [Acidobacteriota bacterium]
MDIAARLALAGIFAALAAIHFYWAAGGSWGVGAAVPSAPSGPALFKPGPWGTSAVALLLLTGAAIATGQLLAPFQSMLLRGMAVIFLLRAVGEFRYAGFFKRVRGTPFAYWDTRLFSPLCIVLSVLSFLGSR